MRTSFSERPGRHERHYRRKLRNRLFVEPLGDDADTRLSEAQRRDHEELIAFLAELREVVQRAVELKPNEESPVVLGLKERLEKLYETAAGLADDQTGNQAAIRELIAVIMGTVRAQAGGDALAAAEMAREEEARALHFALLEEPLVADLLHPDSTIGASELVATLLSEADRAVAAALELFDAEQLMVIYADATRLLQERDPDRSGLPEAQARLRQIGEGIARCGGAPN